VSPAMYLCTYFERIVRERMKEPSEPPTVAVEMMNHLRIVSEGRKAHNIMVGHAPIWKAIYKA
jgi:hypothetical protein